VHVRFGNSAIKLQLRYCSESLVHYALCVVRASLFRSAAAE